MAGLSPSISVDLYISIIFEFSVVFSLPGYFRKSWYILFRLRTSVNPSPLAAAKKVVVYKEKSIETGFCYYYYYYWCYYCCYIASCPSIN